MRFNRRSIMFLLAACALTAIAGAVGLIYTHTAIIVLVAGAAAFSMVLGMAEMYWRLYSWWTPEAMAGCAWPDPVAADDNRLAFTIVLAALHEQQIDVTLDSLAHMEYSNFEVVAALCSCDSETISKAAAAADRNPGKVRLAVRKHTQRHRKAYQLNAAIDAITPDERRRVIIADAEGGCIRRSCATWPPGSCRQTRTWYRAAFSS